MSIPRLSVREYMQVSEVLLKIDDLTDAEMEAVQEMLNRLSTDVDMHILQAQLFLLESEAISVLSFIRRKENAPPDFLDRAA